MNEKGYEQVLQTAQKTLRKILMENTTFDGYYLGSIEQFIRIQRELERINGYPRK